MDTGNVDLRIHDLAARQHGVVTRLQLLGAGLGRGAISHRLRKGTLQPIYRGIYGVGPIQSRHQLEMAVVLACGPEAALSDRTAGAIWGIMQPRQPEAPIEATGPRSLRGPGAGVVLRRRRVPPSPDEVTQRYRLPLTTPARTILDLSSCLDQYDLERVTARAFDRGLATPGEVESLLLRHPHRRGCRTLRALLRDAGGPSLTRSEAERRFLALIRNAGVPRPLANAVVHGLEVDFHWADRGVVVEVDGFAHHSHRSAFENDRRRDGILAAEGLTVLRFTWRQIQREPERVLVRLCLTLGARSSGSRKVLA